MKKLIISMFVITAVVLTGCSSSSYPTAENYPDNRVIVNDGYYPSGFYGPDYYGGGYYPPTSYYLRPYSRRRPAVIYRQVPPPRVIRVNPYTHQNGNWHNNNNNNWNHSNNNNWNHSNNGNNWSPGDKNIRSNKDNNNSSNRGRRS